ncbi:type II secretion system F family protein [bacterium]|nr:type II secretion system F family protein [bacterium]
MIVIKRQISLFGFQKTYNNVDDNTDKFFSLIELIFKRKIFSFSCLFLILLIFLFLFFKNIFISIFFSTVIIIVIFEILQRIKEKRDEYFEVQLAEFISNMIILLKSGKSINQIFKISISWFKKPLSVHLKSFVNEIEFNVPFEKALDNFSQRANNKELRLLTNAIKINNKVGGNFLFIANNILNTVQDNIQIRTKIKTRTAQSKLSGNIIVFFPASGLILMYFTFNSAVEKFMTTGLGITALMIATLLELAGYLAIKKIVREDYL